MAVIVMAATDRGPDGSGPTATPELLLTAEAVGVGNVAEAWRALTRDFYDTVPLGPQARFDAAAAGYWVDGLLLSRVRFDPSTFWREPCRFPSGESDLVTLQWYVRGAIRGSVGEHELHMAPDRVTFHDFALPYRGWSERSEVWGVTLPRDRVAAAELLRTRRPVLSVPVASPSGLMLTGALYSAWEAAERGVGDGRALASALVGLVNGVLGPATGRIADDDRLAAMKTYLRQRLADPALSGTDLQRHFHYSRATVYRLFESDGGVARFIRHERLRRCRDELAHPAPGARPTVRSVAARWGYPDPGQFARSFRRRYGHSPAELLQDARRQSGGEPTARTLRVVQPPQMSSTNRPSARSSASQS